MLNKNFIKKILLFPFQWLYLSILQFKIWLYQKQILSQVQVPGVVISVGNLAMGGSGKTPFVQHLLHLLKKQNLKGPKSTAVIYRAYKARKRHPHRVDIKNSLFANESGDEAFLTQLKNPEVDVLSGMSKSETVNWAVEQKKYDLFIVDDGFQHLRLKRTVDIVLLDATLPVEQSQVLPLGYWREPLSALRRAQFIFLTKTNWASQQNLNLWRQKLSAYSYYEVTYENKKAIELSDWKSFYLKPNSSEFFPVKSLSEYTQKKMALLSGLARNEVFLQSLKTQNIHIQKQFYFSDHHNFTETDINRVKAEVYNSKLDGIIISEKDAVKLSAFNFSDLLVVIPLVELNLPVDAELKLLQAMDIHVI